MGMSCTVIKISNTIEKILLKFFLQSNGTEVVDLLQYLCSNDVDVPVGSIIHTGMQNSRGGYENDCSLARIAPNQ